MKLFKIDWIGDFEICVANSIEELIEWYKNMTGVQIMAEGADVYEVSLDQVKRNMKFNDDYKEEDLEKDYKDLVKCAKPSEFITTLIQI